MNLPRTYLSILCVSMSISVLDIFSIWFLLVVFVEQMEVLIIGSIWHLHLELAAWLDGRCKACILEYQRSYWISASLVGEGNTTTAKLSLAKCFQLPWCYSNNFVCSKLRLQNPVVNSIWNSSVNIKTSRSFQNMKSKNHSQQVEWNGSPPLLCLLRPDLECYVQLWGSQDKKQVSLLERVQRTATKLTRGLKHLC